MSLCGLWINKESQGTVLFFKERFPKGSLFSSEKTTVLLFNTFAFKILS